MPKLSVKDMEAALAVAKDTYKKKFTTGFYHGSPSPNIKAFDSAMNADPYKLETPGVTFVTRDPDFAESFLPGSERGGYKAGATMYPVSVNLGKHWNPKTPEGKQVVADYMKSGAEKNEWDTTENIKKGLLQGNWSVIEHPSFLEHLRDTGHDTFHVMEGGIPNVGVLKPENIRGKFAAFNPEDAASPEIMKAAGGAVQHMAGGKLAIANEVAKFARHPHGQHPKVAQALEEYLKGNISQEERIKILNQHLPIRQWNELPPNYSDDEIRNALMSNKQPKALLPVPAGMRVGNRLDIPAYTQKGVYVDTTHDLSAGNSPISYNRTGHLTDVDFSSKPDKAVRVGLGTQPQALTPMAAEWGADKSPFALIKGTNVGTSDEEVRRMMAEMMQDPAYTQIGMDPRRHSQFYDKSTGLPVWAAEEKLQSGPLILAPKQGLETTTWDDPRLNLSDFEGKQYADGGFISAPYTASGTAFNKLPAAQPVQGGMSTMPNQPVMSFPQSSTPKPLIGPHVLPVQHFDIGGGVKKALQYARSVPFVHFSHKSDLNRLEPGMYGTGIKGKEADRLKDAPDIKPRSYFYVKGENVRPEQGLGTHKYEGMAEGIYPLHEDPAGYSKIAKELAKDPYFAKMGVEIVDQPKHLNELERQIKNAGYSGYADDNVGLLFNPTDVTKVTD